MGGAPADCRCECLSHEFSTEPEILTLCVLKTVLKSVSVIKNIIITYLRKSSSVFLLGRRFGIRMNEYQFYGESVVSCRPSVQGDGAHVYLILTGSQDHRIQREEKGW